MKRYFSPTLFVMLIVSVFAIGQRHSDNDQPVNFGSGVASDGESIRTAFPKLNADLRYLFNLRDITGIRVETVADLDTLTTSGATPPLMDGDRVATLGYRSVNDGGGNVYCYDASSSAAIDNGFVISGPGGVGRFVAINSTVARVRQFGAVGDGVADDGASIQSCFDSPAKVVWFGPGTWLSGTNHTSSVTERLIDLAAGVVKGNNASATAVLTITGNGTRLTNGQFVGDSVNAAEQVRFDGADNVQADSLTFKDSAGKGLVFNSCDDVRVANIYCTNNHQSGVATNGNIQFSICNRAVVQNVICHNTAGKGVSFSGGSFGEASNIQYINDTYGSSADSGFYATECSRVSCNGLTLKNSFVKLSKNCTKFALSNVDVETDGFHPIYLQGCSDGRVSDVKVRAAGTGADAVASCIKILQHPTGPVSPSDIDLFDIVVVDSGDRDAPIVIDGTASKIRFRNLTLTSDSDASAWLNGAFVSDFGADTQWVRCRFENTGTATNTMYEDELGGADLYDCEINAGACDFGILTRTSGCVVDGCTVIGDGTGTYGVRGVAAIELRNSTVRNFTHGVRCDADANVITQNSIDVSSICCWLQNANVENTLILHNDLNGTTSINWPTSTTNVAHQNTLGGALTDGPAGTVSPGAQDSQGNTTR